MLTSDDEAFGAERETYGEIVTARIPLLGDKVKVQAVDSLLLLAQSDAPGFTTTKLPKGSIKDLKAAVGRVAAHLGLERSDAELEAVAARSSFEVMKAEAAARDAETLKKGGSIKKDHFREGKTGGWRELMSPELQREFDEKTAALEAAAAGGHAFRAV